MADSPTSRSLLRLRRSGYSACVVERFLPQARVRRDAFGADILACHATRKELLLVQATTVSNLASRLKKVRQLPEVKAWIRSGGKFECWGWGCPGSPGLGERSSLPCPPARPLPGGANTDPEDTTAAHPKCVGFLAPRRCSRPPVGSRPD
jgi:hypothetical protein